jgi:hypothetical protein
MYESLTSMFPFVMLAMAGGDEEAVAAAELQSLSTHLRASGVVVVTSIIALSAQWSLFLLLPSLIDC